MKRKVDVSVRCHFGTRLGISDTSWACLCRSLGLGGKERVTCFGCGGQDGHSGGGGVMGSVRLGEAGLDAEQPRS